MAKWGSAEFDELCVQIVKELAARLLTKVVDRTPVGDYPSGSGKTGGTLRRGWTGGKSQAVKAYLKTVAVEKVGADYVLTIENPIEYGIYVEYGHRQTPGRFVPAIGKRLVKAWVPGQFMLTKSEREIEAIMQPLIEKMMMGFFREVFDAGSR